MSNNQISDIEKFFTPIEDKEHLQAWLQYFLGFTLPDCKVTKWATSTPLDFVFDVYRAIIDGKSLSTLAISGRDGSKTVSLSVIELLGMTHDQRSSTHFGMVRKQASRARAYLDNYIAKIAFLRQSVQKENTTEIRLNIGGEDVALELLPCTKKAAQGNHSSLVSWDEIGSSNDPTLIAGYRDTAGVPGASNKGKPAVTIKISSRHAAHSLVEEEIRSAAKSNLKIVGWTTLDCTERCGDERSGTKKAPLFINVMKGMKYTPEEFQALLPADREGFELIEDTFIGCQSCPLAVICQGALKRQTSTSKLLRRIDDVITKVFSAGSHDWTLSQLMSMKPSSEGQVYFEFNRSVHVATWERMWERLTGEKPSNPVTRWSFIHKCQEMGCEFLAGEDWGFSAPSTCVVIAIDSRDNIYVLDARCAQYKSDPEWVNIIASQVQPIYNIQMHAPDSENPSGIKLMREAGLPVTEIDKGKGSVKAGINAIKRFLRVPGTNAETKLLIAPDITSGIDGVPGLIEEFELYHKKTNAAGEILDDELPEKQHDHSLDALRYIIYWRFGKSLAQVSFAGQETSPQQAILEQAQRQGNFIVYDNSEEVQIGEGFRVIEKAPDPNPQDPKDPKTPSGPGKGLVWTW